ncbi:MAG: 50S ribosomal protein L29 [Acidimicrobiia bacterium]|nr:50S ribosomal protein L29 [Acidimicrobiia bacterium]
MKSNKIREMDADELSSQDHEIQEQLFRLRLQMKMGQTEGLKKYRALRKDRARILTVQRDRQIASKGKS